MIWNFIKKKYARNKILFLLFAGFLITSSIGYYYTLIRETKTTYHYAVKDGTNKDFRIFFERNSEIDEDKKIIKELFNFDYGTVINIKDTKAYFIFKPQDQKFNQIYEYDFDKNESNIFYANENNKEILDSYLNEENLYVLTSKELLKFNIETKKEESLTLLSQPNLYNEFLNISDQKIVISSDSCKFVKEKCKNGVQNKFLVYDIKIKKAEEQVKNITNQDLFIINSYFGTNKVYKLVKLLKYNNDKGNLNYTLRIFTQP